MNQKTTSKYQLVLLGCDISHSRSPYVYTELLKINCEYELLDIPLTEKLESPAFLLTKFDGVSITAPYKKKYLNDVILHKTSELTQSINCLYKEDDKIFGANTDYLACEKILDESYSDKDFFYILGDGAMAKTIEFILKSKNLEYKLLSRKLGDNLNEFNYIHENSVIINCCSRSFEFGAKPSLGSSFWDLNYSHEKNASYCKALNIPYRDGFELLVEQARQAIKFWKL